MPIAERALFLAAAALSCSKSPSPMEATGSTELAGLLSPSASAPVTPPSPSAVRDPPVVCGGGRNMTVHFYDVGQALAALVDLPDGRHLLVDAGDSPKRPECGPSCAAKDRHLIEALGADLGGAAIDLLWVTHQHSDHIGGAPEVLSTFHVVTYVDNGRDARKPEVSRPHRVGVEQGTMVRVVDPDHPTSPIADSADIKIAPIVPAGWPRSCAHDANDCSIGLRVDYCASSVLFTGDAEHAEEAQLDPHGHVTLLQVAHHGSETSSTPGFLAKVRPSYAVISAGKPGEGLNVDYCHPRALIAKRLTTLMGGAGSQTLRAFDGDRCAGATSSDWVDVPTSDHLWSTSRDGDVVLTTMGDGTFRRN